MSRRKKSHAPAGKFAMIPVTKAKAVLGDLSAPEFRVWFALCLQCQHWANGTGKLCRTVLNEHHLGSRRVVTAAIKVLIEKGHVVRTRIAKQRVCALYGVTHLPLNTDALAREGFSDDEIRITLRRFSGPNSGTANSGPTEEPLNDKTDNRGTAKPAKPCFVDPQGNHNGHFSTTLADPQGNPSKNLPFLSPNSGPDSSPDSGPNPAPIGGRSHSRSARQRA